MEGSELDCGCDVNRVKRSQGRLRERPGASKHGSVEWKPRH
jgi:hypothetical protein